MHEYKIAIVGSRNWDRKDRIEFLVGALPLGTMIVSGQANGVDRFAEKAATDRSMRTAIFPADWDQYGKRAGFIRNQLIVDAADAVFAFWDGKSKGTEDTISKAKKSGKPVHIFRADKSLADSHIVESMIEILDQIDTLIAQLPQVTRYDYIL